jgi:DNA-binding YbaB/EbfC family protein
MTDPTMPDLGALLAQAQAMQQQMLAAQQSLADERVTGSAGGGLVSAVVDGRGDLLALQIAPDAVDLADPDGLETLADLVVAAVRDARAQAEQMANDSIAQVAGGLSGSLGDLFGDPPALGEPDR